MSVVFSTPKPARRWISLWPLGLFLLLAIVAGLLLWQYWPNLMMQSIVWQRSVNLEVSGLLKRVAENPGAAGGALLLFSFPMGCFTRSVPAMAKWLLPPGLRPIRQNSSPV